MDVITDHIKLTTKADSGMHDITPDIEKSLKNTKLMSGIVTIFCVGSTGAISTVEFEPGLQKDIPEALDIIAPKNKDYAHHQTWHDDNGRSHVKASIIGPSITVPFNNQSLMLGTWQQIVFIECDTKPRKRKIVLQYIGKF
jgi:secondary thiamine-phosphate synthase enzyme